MAKRILMIAALVLLLGFLYVGYTTYDDKRSGASGDVSSPNDSTASSSGARDRHVTPESSDSKQLPESPIVYPAANQTSSAAATLSAPANQSSQPGTGGTGLTAPATDTISPNPPNGMVFSGTGHYQLYRQGNITWRLNTDNGQSCVLFATDEEWKKPRVLRAGCGKS